MYLPCEWIELWIFNNSNIKKKFFTIIGRGTVLLLILHFITLLYPQDNYLNDFYYFTLKMKKEKKNFFELKKKQKHYK